MRLMWNVGIYFTVPCFSKAEKISFVDNIPSKWNQWAMNHIIMNVMKRCWVWGIEEFRAFQLPGAPFTFNSAISWAPECAMLEEKRDYIERTFVTYKMVYEFLTNIIIQRWEAQNLEPTHGTQINGSHKKLQIRTYRESKEGKIISDGQRMKKGFLEKVALDMGI